MDADSLNKWLTLSANLVVLVEISLLVFEIRQNQDIRRAQTMNEITQWESSGLPFPMIVVEGVQTWND